MGMGQPSRSRIEPPASASQENGPQEGARLFWLEKVAARKGFLEGRGNVGKPTQVCLNRATEGTGGCSSNKAQWTNCLVQAGRAALGERGGAEKI
jgi:hypothetical protein